MHTEKKRAIIFMDGTNFFLQVIKGMKLPVLKLNIVKLCQNLVESSYTLLKIYFYTAPLSQQVDKQAYREQQILIQRLKNNPLFNVKTGRTVKSQDFRKCKHCRETIIFRTRKEKGVDVNLVTDMLTLCFYDHYDKAILISNDSDFYPAVTEIKKRKNIDIACYPLDKEGHIPVYIRKYCEENDLKLNILDYNYLKAFIQEPDQQEFPFTKNSPIE